MSGRFGLIVASFRGDLERELKAMARPIAKADARAMRQVTDIAKVGARRSVGAAGFSSKWQNAIRGRVYLNEAELTDDAGLVWLRSKYGGIFERGGDPKGKPTLWIPIEDNLPASKTRWTPREFNERIGPLSFVPAGHGHGPLLVGRVAVTGKGQVRAAPQRGNSQRAARSRTNFFVRSEAKQLPLFAGVTSVHINKKFDIAGEARAAMKQFPALFAKNLKG